jgi:proteasome lid subunit RPN8/RPN11
MKDDEIIFEDFEEENPFKKLVRKVIIRIIALVLILLFASYLLAFYAFDFFESRSESSVLDKDSLTFATNGKTIQFDEAVYEKLKSIYFANPEHEFKACLFGEVKENTYFIKSVVEPKVFSQSPFHVSAEPCTPSAIIDLHSHPFQKCIASATDISYLNRLKSVNPIALMAVMCEQDRMSFYA